MPFERRYYQFCAFATLLLSLAIDLRFASGQTKKGDSITTPSSQDTLQPTHEIALTTTPRNYFDYKSFETEVCKPGRGMWESGPWGFGVLPLPTYREKEGWGFGGGAYISRGADDLLGAWGVFRTIAWINEWEDRWGVISTLSPYLYRSPTWKFSTPVQFFDQPGREGWSVSARLDWSGAEQGRWGNYTIQAASERLTGREMVGSRLWETGDHRWLRFASRSRGVGIGFLRALDLQTELLNAFPFQSPEFNYWRASFELSWATPNAMAWVAGGSASGEIPAQQLFDLATDGRIASLPLWSSLAVGFVSAGVEARERIMVGHFIGLFTTGAHARGFGATLWEGGLSYTFTSGSFLFDAHEWDVRLDFPIYSSQAEALGASTSWSLARFRLSINVPLPGIDRDQIVRYRYAKR